MSIIKFEFSGYPAEKKPAAHHFKKNGLHFASANGS